MMNFIKRFRERKNKMSFTKTELNEFAKDYASDEPGAGPAAIYNPEAAEASRRISQDGFTDVEAITPTLSPRQKIATEQLRVGGRWATKNSKSNEQPKVEVKKQEQFHQTEHSRKLFLVEGLVRMQRITGDGGVVQVDQKRIIWASDVDEAMAKFENCFRNLSNPSETYVVVRAVGSEAID
jgi:hypothetical protein